MKLKIPGQFGAHTQEIIHGAAVALCIKAAGALILFGYNVLLARILGPQKAGLYYLAVMAATTASVIGRMGVDNAVVRFSAAAMTTGNWPALKGLYYKGILVVFCVSFCAAVCLFGAGDWISNRVFGKPDLVLPMRLASMCVVPLTILLIYSELLKGLKRIRDSQLIQGGFMPALAVIGLVIFGRMWGVNGAVLAYVNASVLAAIIGFAMWRRATPQLRDCAPRFPLSDLLLSAMPLFWVSSIQILSGYISTFFLGVFASAGDIGIFEIASRVSMLISFILVSVNTIAAPKFSELYSQGNRLALCQTARDCVKLMAVVAGPLFLLFVLAPEWILGLFGATFVRGTRLLIILSVGQFVNVVTGSVGYLLIMSGNEKALRNVTVCVAAQSFVLNLVLIKAFGVVGAAIATAAGVVSYNSLALILVKKKLNFWTLPFPGLPRPVSA